MTPKNPLFADFACMICLMIVIVCNNIAHADVLPNLAITTGAARQVTIQELCTTSTKLVRNVPESEKMAVYYRYKMNGNDKSSCKEGYEIDHLISLELGGSNDISNLWPQSFCGINNAHDKDKLENKLHALVCSGKMQLQDAQSCISKNWIDCQKRIMK